LIEKKLIETIADKYGLNHIDSIIRLEGGERNKVYKISNLDLVIRIYQPTALLEGILFEHRLMSLLSKQMACVVEPLLYGHDNSYFIFEACPVAVLPYINGVKPTHNDCKESAFCYKAGCILGQMHRIAMENKDDFPTLISRIPLIQMNPYSNHLYNWEKAVKYLSLTDFNAELPYIKKQLEELWSFIVELKDMTLIPIHGDYYKGNLLWNHEEITGIIDFDDARNEWAEFEISKALWEFTRNYCQLNFDKKRLNAFLTGYSYSNPHIKHDFEVYAEINRLIRLQEILGTATSMITGDLLYKAMNSEDFKYHWQNLLWCKENE